MDYEKKYKKALEKAREIYKEDFKAMWLENLFPELKESEDEKIRKQILSFLKEFECDHYRNLDFSSWIAWLEKQGEQKSIDKIEPKFKVGDWITCKKVNTALILDIEDGKYFAEHVDGNKGFHNIDYIDNHFHLWTIEDAKAGDVLVDVYSNIGIFEKRYGINWYTYCYLDCEGRFISEGGSHGSICYPATKEQRDLLFQKIKEAEYNLKKED